MEWNKWNDANLRKINNYRTKIYINIYIICEGDGCKSEPRGHRLRQRDTLMHLGYAVLAI